MVILGDLFLSLFEPTINTQRHIRVGPLPAPPRYVTPNFKVVFPRDGVSLRVERRRGCNELVGRTIRLGDWTVPGTRGIDQIHELKGWKDISDMKISGRTTLGGWLAHTYSGDWYIAIS